MQDKYTKERHEALVDQGWRSMAAMLDAEMPPAPAAEQTKRRRAIWIWLLAATGLFAGLALMQLAQTRPAEQKKPAEAQSLPAIAQAQLSDPAVSPGQVNAEEVQASTSSSVRLNNPGEGAAWKPSRSVPAYSAEEHGLYPEEKAVWSAMENTSIPALDPQQLFIPQPSPVQLLVQPELPVLPGKQLFASDAPQINPVWTVPSVRRAAKKLRFGVEAAVGIGFAQGVNRIAIGPAAVWKAGPRVALQSGFLVGSSRYHLSLSGGTTGRANVNAPVSSVNSPLDVLAEQVYNGQELTLTSLTLQIPAVLSYRISPRMRVETGLSAGYIINSKNIVAKASTEDLASGGGISTSNSYTQVQIDQAVSNSVARWEFLLSAGFRYQASADWSIGLHYQHGLNDLLADQNLQARQRNLRLSGMMYF